MGRLKVIQESDTGRNEKFKDKKTGEILTRAQVVKKIKNNDFEDYYVRIIHGVKTPVSKPNGQKNDNLE